MYKFSNGLIFYTREDAEKAIKAGYKLIEKQISIDEAINEQSGIANKSVGKSGKSTKKTTRKAKRSI